MLSHRNLLSLTQMMALTNDGLYTTDTVNLVVAPLFHIGGTGVTYIGLAHGCHNIMHETFEPQRVVEAIQGHGVSSMFMVPAMIQAIVKLVPNAGLRFQFPGNHRHGASPISASCWRRRCQSSAAASAKFSMTETQVRSGPGPGGPCARWQKHPIC